MNINDYDSTMDNSTFLVKVDNIFIKLLSGVMFDELDNIKHKVSDEVINRYKSIIDNNKERNVTQMFDELNVKTSSISDIKITEDKIIVTVNLISRYMNYYIDSNTGNYKSGNNREREEHLNILTLEKRKDAKDMKVSMHCPSCGNPINYNANGVCDYCGTVFNTSDFDYILTNIITS